MDPGARVPVRDVEIGADMVRELVRRGIDSGILDAFRTAQSVAWRLWMEICFCAYRRRGAPHEVLSVSSRSIGVFIDDTVAALADQIAVAKAQPRGHPCRAPRRGGPDPRGRTDRRCVPRPALHYRVAGPQTAVVLRGTGMSMSRLEAT